NCPHPGHDDAHPSAALYSDAEGIWRCKCHACGWCGDLFDLRALRTGKPLADVLREARGEPRTDAPSAKSVPDMEALAKRYYATISDEQRQNLVDRLGVSADALRRLRVGWCERDGSYSF